MLVIIGAKGGNRGLRGLDCKMSSVCACLPYAIKKPKTLGCKKSVS